jgi:hypothetical protein
MDVGVPCWVVIYTVIPLSYIEVRIGVWMGNGTPGDRIIYI